MESFNKLAPSEVERLAVLNEECGEVIQAISKILRHGYESKWPREVGLTNRFKLEREIGHVLNALLLIQQDLNIGHVLDALADKKRDIIPFLHYQKND